jgi:hypothetical protein
MLVYRARGSATAARMPIRAAFLIDPDGNNVEAVCLR